MKIAIQSIPLFILFLFLASVEASELRENHELDAKVRAFLNSGIRWRDLPNYETAIESRGGDVSIRYKKAG